MLHETWRHHHNTGLSPVILKDVLQNQTHEQLQTAMEIFFNFLGNQFLNNTVFFVHQCFLSLVSIFICPLRISLDCSFLLCLLLQLKHQNLELGRFFCSPLALPHFPLKRNLSRWSSLGVLLGIMSAQRQKIREGLWALWFATNTTVLYVQFFQNELDCNLISLA